MLSIPTTATRNPAVPITMAIAAREDLVGSLMPMAVNDSALE